MNLYNRRSNNITKWWFSLDHNIFFAFILLLLVGLVMSRSTSPFVAEKIGLNSLYFYHKHIFFMFMAVVTALLFSMLKTHLILRISLFFLIFFLFLVAIIIFTEDHTKGAKRWLRILGFTLQPSEFVKPFFIVINSWFLSRKFVRENYKGYLCSCILFSIIIAGLVLQPDFGMTLMITILWAIQLFIFGLPMAFIAIIAILCLAGGIVAYITLPHVTSRINS